MSLHAVEWSAVLAVSSDDDVSKRRDHGPRRNEQEKQSGDLRLDHLAQAAPEPDPKTSGDQGKDQPSPHSRSCNRMQVGGRGGTLPFQLVKRRGCSLRVVTKCTQTLPLQPPGAKCPD